MGDIPGKCTNLFSILLASCRFISMRRPCNPSLDRSRHALLNLPCTDPCRSNHEMCDAQHRCGWTMVLCNISDDEPLRETIKGPLGFQDKKWASSFVYVRFLEQYRTKGMHKWATFKACTEVQWHEYFLYAWFYNLLYAFEIRLLYFLLRKKGKEK